jgi:hypothetical protein
MLCKKYQRYYFRNAVAIDNHHGTASDNGSCSGTASDHASCSGTGSDEERDKRVDIKRAFI